MLNDLIFRHAWIPFTAAQKVYYKDSTVRITGRIALYNNKPKIVVNSPKRIPAEEPIVWQWMKRVS